MKNAALRSAGRVWRPTLSWAVLLALALTLAAQKDFNQSEKATIENFKRAKVHYDKGMDYLRKGNLEKARKEADASLEIFPVYADGHLLLALLQYQQGSFEPALKEIETAESGFGAISEFYAVSYQDHFARLREQRNEAAARLEELKASGKDQILVSEAQHALAVKDEELRSWKPDVALAMPAEYHFVHGNILFKMKRLEEAQGKYLAALQADPRYANAYTNLIAICLARGDAANALKYLRQAEGNGVALNEKLKQAVLQRQ
jgi:tetratricopeptide (TPR) repeat protein